jgi:hypothetical protein
LPGATVFWDGKDRDYRGLAVRKVRHFGIFFGGVALAGVAESFGWAWLGVGIFG